MLHRPLWLGSGKRLQAAPLRHGLAHTPLGQQDVPSGQITQVADAEAEQLVMLCVGSHWPIAGVPVAVTWSVKLNRPGDTAASVVGK